MFPLFYLKNKRKEVQFEYRTLFLLENFCGVGSLCHEIAVFTGIRLLA